MDPIGVSASLITIVGVVIQSTKTIIEIRHADSDVQQCATAAQELQSLLDRFTVHENHGQDEDEILERLLRKCAEKVGFIKDSLVKMDRRTTHSMFKGVMARARAVLSQQELRRYCEQIHYYTSAIGSHVAIDHR